MNTQELNKAVVRRFNEAFIEQGVESVHDEIVAPDFVNHLESSGATTGREEGFFLFTKMFRPAFPDLKVIIHDQFAEGDTVVTRKSYRGTHQGEFMGMAPSGREVSIPVIEIIKLRDGRYVEHWANADMSQLAGPPPAQKGGPGAGGADE